jgi:tetratricopeptide (TPR) repeat protein
MTLRTMKRRESPAAALDQMSLERFLQVFLLFRRKALAEDASGSPELSQLRAAVIEQCTAWAIAGERRRAIALLSKLIGVHGRFQVAASSPVRAGAAVRVCALVWAQLGELRERAGELPGALAAYERANQLNPKMDGIALAIARLRPFILMA